MTLSLDDLERDPRRLLRTGEVAGLFQVDRKTVTRWATGGRIGSIRTPGGHLRIPAREVLRLFKLPEVDVDLAQGQVD